MNNDQTGHDIRAVANEILKRARAKGVPLTIMQLIKLAYFAHGWTLAILNRPLASQKAQAWQYGPVFPHLYKSLKGSGSRPIDDEIRDKVTKVPYRSRFKADEGAIIDAVIEGYGKTHAFNLSDITHENGSPWDNVFNSHGPYSEIPDSLIAVYFKKLLSDGQRTGSQP